MFTADLPKCPSTDSWLNIVVYSDSGILYSNEKEMNCDVQEQAEFNPQ